MKPKEGLGMKILKSILNYIPLPRLSYLWLLMELFL